MSDDDGAGVSDLFPTGTSATAVSSNSTSTSSATTTTELPLFSATNTAAAKGPNTHTDVYYYVLLGVLIVLIALAALLTYRGQRMRRRYRTAHQLALERGDPPPWWNTSDSPNIWVAGFGRNPPGPMDQWATMGGRRRERRWVRIPVLWDVVAEREPKDHRTGSVTPSSGKRVAASYASSESLTNTHVGDDGDDMILTGKSQPLTLHSLLPEPVPDYSQAAGAATAPDMRSSSGARTGFGFFRNGLPRPEPEEGAGAPATTTTAGTAAAREREIDRAAATGVPGEPVRMAVLIQMPTDGHQVPYEDGEGWAPGMELGVWEGHVAAATGTGTPLSMSDSRR